MRATFLKLNEGWNSDPNAPEPRVEVQGADLLLSFLVNATQFPEFRKDELGTLRFANCLRYRLGPTNDEGWNLGQCRFSALAPAWGEFYQVEGEPALLTAPQDWIELGPPGAYGQHFLFYFRDETFECVAERCLVEERASNALWRAGKRLGSAPAAMPTRPFP